MNQFPRFFALPLTMIILSAVILIVWAWALIDLIMSRKEPIEKLLWLIVILAFNFIGALIYLSFGRKHRMRLSRKKLRRSKDRVIAGVAGGMAEYFDVDPVAMRLLWVLFAFVTGGTAIIVYLIAALMIPER